MVSLKEFGKFREKFWTTRDGRKIRIKNLTNEHLVNIIWHIHDYSRWYPVGTREQFINEAEYRNIEWGNPTIRMGIPVTPPKVKEKKYLIIERLDGKLYSYFESEMQFHKNNRSIYGRGHSILISSKKLDDECNLSRVLNDKEFIAVEVV